MHFSGTNGSKSTIFIIIPAGSAPLPVHILPSLQSLSYPPRRNSAFLPHRPVQTERNRYARLARLVYRILTDKIKKSEGKGKPDLNLLFIYNMPFRGIAKMTGGAASMEMARGIVDMVNGKWLSGTKRVIKGYFRNNKENKKYEKQLEGKEKRE